MDVVWIKLSTQHGNVVAHMFGSGGIVNMRQNETNTSLLNATMVIDTVQESVDEIITLIGSARNGVKVSAE